MGFNLITPVTPEALLKLAKSLLDEAVSPLAENNKDCGTDCVDIVGTGGDGHDTINASTAAAIIASCYTPVAKHGMI